jgi:predicted ATPase
MPPPVGQSNRWQDVERIYHDALARDAGERSQFLRSACSGDEALQREVESLLAYASDAQVFMQTPAIEVLTPAAIPSERELDGRLAAGMRIGPYTIVAPLGSGGMGEVYHAHDARLGRDVALKMLPRRVTGDRAAVERFSREARAASALNHPNIITIYEIGETEAGRFIVMELVQGRTLRAMLPQPFAADHFARLGTQMARALAVAHAAGIVHRDVKPENVMARDDGYVKLLDFGLARLTHVDAGQSDAETEAKTTPGSQLGTMRYMSPEQARGDTTTAATDIFSLGIVFYEMAAGRRPFMADSEIGVLHAIVSEAPQPPSRLNPEIARPLDALILQMLEKDARLRPTAAEVEAALGEIAGTISAQEPRRVAPDTKRHTVGRTHERAELHRTLTAAGGGHGLLMCVSGEPGIGKTTLMEDFLDELAGQPYRIARGRCSERLAGTEAYLPWLEALESLLRGEGSESVTRLMKMMAPTWYVSVAPLASADASSAHVTTSAPPASQERMKREMSGFLQEVSRLRPLVLFFDDVHWADVSTIDLLAYLGTRLGALPILIVTTYRPSELLLAQHPFLHLKLDLQARGLCREMPLAFLTADDIARYLALEFPEHRFPADLPAVIHAKTEGNPLFMADLVRHLRDSKVIDEERGTWVLVRSIPDLQRQMPESVRSMIQTKIAQLGEADRRLLAAGSVQGYEFDSAVAARTLALDAADVEERLEALERVHCFVARVSEYEFPDRTVTLRYRFVHVLYQNALYTSLQPTRKASWSAAVAEALIGYYGKQRSAIASELAMLFESARDFERAAEYFLTAALQAAHVSANKEAVALARRGLNALTLLPETPERLEQELRLQTTLGPALMGTVGFGSREVEAVYTRAQTLCRQIGDTPQVFPVMWGLWQYWLSRAEYATALDLSRQLVAMAQKVDDRALLLMAEHSFGNTLWLLGDFEKAAASAERHNTLYVPEQHHALASRYGGYDTGVAGLFGLAVNVWPLGYPDRAALSCREGIALAHGISHAYSVAFAFTSSAMVHQWRRDVERTRHDAEAAMTLAAEHELAAWLTWATVLFGWAIAEQGQPDEGLARIREGIAGWRAGGARCLDPYFLALLAETHAKAGDVEDAQAALAEAFAITAETHEGLVEADLHRLKGDLLRDRGEAEACFHQAMTVARRQKARSFELRAVMRLSRLYATQGKRAEARQMLADVYGWFTEGFDTGDLRDAAALLRELER